MMFSLSQLFAPFRPFRTPSGSATLADLRRLFAQKRQTFFLWKPANSYTDSTGITPAGPDTPVGLVLNSAMAEPEARRNLCVFSENPSNRTATNITVNLTGDNLNGVPVSLITAANSGGTGQAVSVISNASHVSGAYYYITYVAKAGSGQYLQLVGLSGAFGYDTYVNIDLSDGSIGAYGTKVYGTTTTSLGDGWYKIKTLFLATTSATAIIQCMIVGSKSAGRADSITLSGQTIYITYAQVETGGFSTYQPVGASYPIQWLQNGIIAAGVQATTANKPTLRRSAITQRYFLDSPGADIKLTATLGNLGTDCSIARLGFGEVTWLHGQTVSSTFDITTLYGLHGAVFLTDRRPTATEMRMVESVMLREKASYSSIVHAMPQLRKRITDTESDINFAARTNLLNFWAFDSKMTSFPVIDTGNATNINYAWNHNVSLTSFPLLNISKATQISYTWEGCAALTSFPVLDTSKGVSFSYTWRGCTSLTSFPQLDMSSATTVYGAWYGCNGLTSFPVLNIANCTTVQAAWRGCNKLTAFPLLDVRNSTSFNVTWADCSLLSTFPAGMFDNWSATPANSCFSNAWYGCNALTEQSVLNILSSIATSGKSAPASGVDITVYGAPTIATIRANSSIMTAVNTLKSRGWNPTYKGTAI